MHKVSSQKKKKTVSQWMFGSAALSPLLAGAPKMTAASSREFLKANDYRAQMSMPAGF